MSTVNTVNTIASVTAEPLSAAPGTEITLTAVVLDENGAPASGATVTWVSLNDQTSTTSDTDATGVATYFVQSDTYAFMPYAVYVDDDTSTATLTEARFYDANTPRVFVPNGMDGELDQYDVAEEVQVIIEPFEEVRAQDVLTFWWDDIHSFTKQVTDPATDFPLAINISNTFPPACLANGTYELFYQYIDTRKNVLVSPPWTVSVTGGVLPPTLPAPTFPQAADDGWINKREADAGIQIDINYTGMLVNDELAVTWQLYDEKHIQIDTLQIPHTVVQDDIDRGYIELILTTDQVPPVQSGSAQAWYTVTPANHGDVQSSIVGEVGVDTIA
ncbi:hypothetical protein [Pseudescherichia sp.]|uniref:hypothetical protein n=1 Tax=Pseudescherichia sp. TaxID=2055881 RepID=UPI00289956F7|nr:hypothetical protein [Pseudescherichia sp.]